MDERNPKIIEVSRGESTSTYILQNGAKLGEVFDFLPAGIVNKTETGIGATTLELNSERNSIIVEPIRVTASRKAKKTPGSLYVGSPTPEFNQKVTNDKIKAYIDSPGGKHKKLIVVADSLPRVIEAIGENVYRDYFLMIDEIDAFQNDAAFRGSMEKSLDYYKKFPQTNRALVTATPLGFSDPELEHEHQTIIQYETPVGRDIALIYTDNVSGSAFDHIKEQLQTNPGQKIAIAFNSVTGCRGLAQKLEKDRVVSPAEIKILCSTSSEERVGKYFAELTNEQLPGQVTFFTSAYFNGFDLDERYHLVSISDPTSPITALSDHKLKQIAGRSRPGLLSETVIYGTSKELPEEITAVDEKSLISAAVDEIKAIECFEMNFRNNPVLKNSIKKIRELVVERTRHLKYSLVRLDADGKPQISYFNVDACLETIRVNKEVYQDAVSLKDLLGKNNNIIGFHVSHSKTAIKHDLKKDGEIRKRNAEEAINLLRTTNSSAQLSLLLTDPTLPEQQKKIIREYEALYQFIDGEQLLESLKNHYNPGDARAWNTFKSAAIFAAYDESHPFKQRMNRHFKVGDRYTPEQILKRLNAVFEEAHLGTKLDSPVIAVRMFKLFYATVVKRKSGKRAQEVISDNPRKVTVTMTIKDLTTFDPARFLG
ncbi:hypothetical protein [Adhaeribacter aquaticus]|uniref:hypothetical protein n=1 Tax=Adhaeribacter aquaticus TaxID=299567 RepID=UPI000405199C|nr:hypothetical protein [Adhaeribacter aquaticus]